IVAKDHGLDRLVDDHRADVGRGLVVTDVGGIMGIAERAVVAPTHQLAALQDHTGRIVAREDVDHRAWTDVYVARARGRLVVTDDFVVAVREHAPEALTPATEAAADHQHTAMPAAPAYSLRGSTEVEVTDARGRLVVADVLRVAVAQYRAPIPPATNPAGVQNHAGPVGADPQLHDRAADIDIAGRARDFVVADVVGVHVAEL